MSNDKQFNNSNIYMLNCGINWWGVLMKRSDEPYRRYLAILTT